MNDHKITIYNRTNLVLALITEIIILYQAVDTARQPVGYAAGDITDAFIAGSIGGLVAGVALSRVTRHGNFLLVVNYFIMYYISPLDVVKVSVDNGLQIYRKSGRPVRPSIYMPSIARNVWGTSYLQRRVHPIDDWIERMKPAMGSMEFTFERRWRISIAAFVVGGMVIDAVLQVGLNHLIGS